MAPLQPYISLTGLALVRDITCPDSNKPNTFILFCDFCLQKSGRLTIPVYKYFENGDVPPINSYIMLSGPFWMLPGTDGSIQPDTLDVVTDKDVTLNLTPPSVFAVGTVATVMERDIHLDVGAYNSDTRTSITYQIIVTVPNNRRWTNIKMPKTGSNVAICGVLSYIALHEDIPAIELGNITYLPRTDYSSKSNPTTGVRTKRQLIAEKGVDIGQPMKKTKSGPIEAFTPEELGANSSSGAGSSGASITSSPSGSSGSPGSSSSLGSPGSSGSPDSSESSQSSAVSSSPPDEGGPSASTRSATNSQGNAKNVKLALKSMRSDLKKA